MIRSLLDTACSLLVSAGGSCDPISGNGQTGTYGLVSSCDPCESASPCRFPSLIRRAQLSFAMSEYFQKNNRSSQACSRFGGNGRVNTKVLSSSTASAVASSCLNGY